jgi:peptidoglycan/LPS O-acetylase OafA/YrhL
MKYGSAIADGLVGAGRFFWLRFSRLYPLHFVTLLIVASLQPLHVLLTGDSFVFHDNGVGNFMAQLAMATHWGALVPYSFNGPIWSVSAEVLVYALFFLLMRWLGAGLLTLIVAFLASLVAQGLGKGTPVLFCACFFFAGAIAARLFLGAQSIGQSGRLSIAAATLLAVGFWLWGDGVNAGTMPLFLLGAMPLILLVAAHDWPIPQRWHGAIQAAGNLTYSSYLCHFPLQLLVAIACAAAGLAPPVQSPIFLIAYLAAVLLLSRWVFQRFERPTQAWIRQLAFRRQAIAA